MGSIIPAGVRAPVCSTSAFFTFSWSVAPSPTEEPFPMWGWATGQLPRQCSAWGVQQNEEAHVSLIMTCPNPDYNIHTGRYLQEAVLALKRPDLSKHGLAGSPQRRGRRRKKRMKSKAQRSKRGDCMLPYMGYGILFRPSDYQWCRSLLEESCISKVYNIVSGPC